MYCGHCDQDMIEINRNEYYVFYKCNCNHRKGVEWDWKTALDGDVEYSLGSADSFVHDCPECSGVTYRANMSNEICVRCGEARIVARVAS